MGIKHFFTWFKQTFPTSIINFQESTPPTELVEIDTFMIDLNGVFHNSAQKIYQYGNHARPRSMLGRKQPAKSILQEKCFEDICNTIEKLVKISQPKKKLVLCIDGVAPQSKQNQQRQRRYRSSIDEDNNNLEKESIFDTCSITPGTKFMDYLSKYIDWYIRKRISESPIWANLEIVFSNEKVPGEGEHKLINYIRKFGMEDETFCINALDADLVMLSLATHKPRFYLLREDLYTSEIDYMYVDIGQVRKDLLNLMKWSDSPNEKKIVNDFILICFLCGNDFLPNIPSIAIMDKGLDTIIDLYKMACRKEDSYLTDDQNRFIKNSFKSFLHLISISEKPLLEQKILHKNDYISEPLLEKYTHTTNINNPNQNEISNENSSDENSSDGNSSNENTLKATINLDFENYRKEYYELKGMNKQLEKICHMYLEGCQWVLTYYTKGISDWTWLFPFHYSPFACELVQNIDTYCQKDIIETSPLLPFQQLLCVLPPKSSYLVPVPLNNLFKAGSSLSKYYPETFHINYEGKKRKWEGVVELPVVDIQEVRRAYSQFAGHISDTEKRRNIVGKSFSYKFSTDFTSEFKSYFGNIKHCNVEVEEVLF